MATSFRRWQERKVTGINSVIETGTTNVNYLASNTIHHH